MLQDELSIVDRDIRIPLYHQLKTWIIRQIESGELDPGSQIPPEMSLCSSLGLSRTTVREALNQLVADGWLYRVHGVGTFVKDSQVEPSMAQRLTSFSEDMQEQQIPYTSMLLSRELVPAPLYVAACLQVAPGTKIVRLERLGSTQGEPLVLADTYMPCELCPDIMERDLTDRSLYKLLEEAYGLVIAKARRTLQPTSATPYEAEKLHISPGDPIHLMKSISYLASDRPIEYSKLRFRGDRSRFVFTLDGSVLTRNHSAA
ncbi:MAG TPA: GntR family transcriptional regulator [Anaerolineae bacterium]|nr:GntR family transcriptional regulator [Anaerolineae bacterium]